MLRNAAIAVSVAVLAFPASAQQIGSDDSTFEDGILVTSSDVQSCPYRFVQPVTVNVTEDYGADTRPKIFRKLRDQAKKVAADAIVLVQTAWAWNRRSYTGRAIRYVDRKCAPTS
jgi:uncharacterized protein YbjQ (UPF0145 family)